MDFQLHLETDTVEQASPSPAVCAAPDDSIRSVLRLLREAQTGAAMICRDEKLLGLCTERDLVRYLASEGNLSASVSSIMVRDPVALQPQDSLATAITLMAGRGFRQLPVVDAAGRIQGVLNATGILHYLVQHFPKVVYTLPPAPHHKTAEREGA
ncbi:cyclic nucleotide-binding/CBS domain-containing protein [Anatilimnocola sp. NA78]|uniref:CBS domain-containing protein n=1 Tax=Anatilimnocola sp. NA78 TaxID=3415683 RepID=UPI003CE5618C